MASRDCREHRCSRLVCVGPTAGSPCPACRNLLDHTPVTCARLRPNTSLTLDEIDDMIPLNLTGKVALVTGVGDNVGFAWYIAKALQAAGARLIFVVHPRLMGIVENILERDADADTRVLPFG